jgi:hypothetical protein
MWTCEPIPGTDHVRLTEHLDLREIRAAFGALADLTPEHARAMAAAMSRETRKVTRAVGVNARRERRGRKVRRDVLP